MQQMIISTTLIGFKISNFVTLRIFPLMNMAGNDCSEFFCGKVDDLQSSSLVLQLSFSCPYQCYQMLPFQRRSVQAVGSSSPEKKRTNDPNMRTRMVILKIHN